jgi:hypothetical protein
MYEGNPPNLADKIKTNKNNTYYGKDRKYPPCDGGA